MIQKTVMTLFLILSMSSVWARIGVSRDLPFGIFLNDDYIVGELSRQVAPEKKRKDQNHLMVYKAMVDESINLKNYCEISSQNNYAVLWDQIQLTRSLLATLQFMGIRIAIQAIPQYAKFFNFSEEEFQNLVSNISGNYCSQNISVMSIKKIKRELMKEFKGSRDSIPTIKDHTYFSNNYLRINNPEDLRKKEFLLMIKLFRSFCSWGGSSEDSRLMLPFVTNPIVMSHVIREQVGKKLVAKDIKVLLQDTNETKPVVCNNLICREADMEAVKTTLPRPIGSLDLTIDLKKVYCHELRFQDEKFDDLPPKLKVIADKTTMEENNLMISLFLSWITGIPDFLIQSERYMNAFDFLKINFEDYWEKWSKDRVAKLKDNLLYEDMLTLEKVRNSNNQDFAIDFDLNMGEFDRLTERAGKLVYTFHLEIRREYAEWIFSAMNNIDPLFPEQRVTIMESVKKYIRSDVQIGQSHFSFIVQNKEFLDLITEGVVDKIMDFHHQLDDFMNHRKIVKIPVQINIAAMALRYLNYRYHVNRINNEQILK